MTEPTGNTEPLDLRPLPGSERPAARGAIAASAALSQDSPIEATLVLRRRAEVPESALDERLSREELAQRYGADPADVATVVSTVIALGAEVLESDAASRRVRVSGSPAVLSRIFGTTLDLVTGTAPDGSAVTFRQRTGELSVPTACADAIIAVLGLDNRPQTNPRFRVAAPAAVTSSYTPPQVGQVYRFPEGMDGRGQTVAILELGGGFRQTDLDIYFRGLGIASPSVTAVGVDGGANRPGEDADGEVMLDIEIVGATGPCRRDRRVLRAEHGQRFSRRAECGGARRRHAGVDQHQLGSERGRLDVQCPRRVRSGAAGCVSARGHGHCCGG